MPPAPPGCNPFYPPITAPLRRGKPYAEPMRILEALASVFVNTFGITQPTPEGRRRAAWYILGLLLVALTVVAVVGSILYQTLHR